MRRRPSPDTVMALRFDSGSEAGDLALWCDGSVELLGGGPPVVWVPTPHGARPALLGDWIVRRGAGTFRPYAPSDFAAQFSTVEGADSAFSA